MLSDSTGHRVDDPSQTSAFDPPDPEQGVFGKYIITKADGSHVDSSACYFVLRLDEDLAAREAMRVYAAKCGNATLADDITRCLDWLDDTPVCTCGGGRDSDEMCMFHGGGFLGHPKWEHGDFGR